MLTWQKRRLMPISRGWADTLWSPIENKIGDWRMTIELNGKIIAEKTFTVELESQRNENDFWRARGYK